MKIQIAILSIVSAISGCKEIEIDKFNNCDKLDNETQRELGFPNGTSREGDTSFLWYDDVGIIVTYTVSSSSDGNSADDCVMKVYRVQP